MKRTMKHVRRAISVGRAAAVGIKGTGMAMAGGAAHAGITYVIQQQMRDPNGAVSQVGLYLPMAVGIVGGHFLKRYSPSLGTGLVGAGGYQAGQAILTYLLAPKTTTATKGLVEPHQVSQAFRAGLMAGQRVLPPSSPINAGAPSAGAPQASMRRSAGSARTLEV